MAIEVNSPNGIPTGWKIVKMAEPPVLKNERHVQILRNKVINTLDFFIGEQGLWKKTEFINTLKDGEQILGRYKDEFQKVHTLYGIVHNDGNTVKYITIFKSSLDNNDTNNGIEVNNGVVETKLTPNKGVIFDIKEAQGEQGLKLNLNNDGIGVDKQGSVKVMKDNTSLITDEKGGLTVGKVDCGEWTAQ